MQMNGSYSCAIPMPENSNLPASTVAHNIVVHNMALYAPICHPHYCYPHCFHCNDDEN